MRPMPSTLDLPPYKCETSPNRNYNTPNPITHAQTHSRFSHLPCSCHLSLPWVFRPKIQSTWRSTNYCPSECVLSRLRVCTKRYTQRKCYEDQHSHEMCILIRCLHFQCKYISQLPQTVYTWRKTLFNTIQMFIRYRKIIWTLN